MILVISLLIEQILTLAALRNLCSGLLPDQSIGHFAKLVKFGYFQDESSDREINKVKKYSKYGQTKVIDL
jgi:hypothetical protein